MKRTFTQPPVFPDKRPKNYNYWQREITRQLDKTTGTTLLQRLKGVFTCFALLLCLVAHSQTVQYRRIETTHFKGDKINTKTVKYEGGTVDIEPGKITIDKEAPRPVYYSITRTGAYEPEDEGFYSRTYICITENKSRLKALKIVLFWSPKKELVDVVVKDGHKNTDYCLTNK